MAETRQLTRAQNWAWLFIQLLIRAAVFAAGWYWPGAPESWLRQPAAGLAIMLGSALIGLAGCLTLRSSLSAFPQPREKRLATTGLYRWVRHPMYAGLLVLALGWVLWTGSLAALAASFPLAWFLRKKAALEDKILSETYPEHAHYAARTWCFFSGKKVEAERVGSR